MRPLARTLGLFGRRLRARPAALAALALFGAAAVGAAGVVAAVAGAALALNGSAPAVKATATKKVKCRRVFMTTPSFLRDPLRGGALMRTCLRQALLRWRAHAQTVWATRP